MTPHDTVLDLTSGDGALARALAPWVTAVHRPDPETADAAPGPAAGTDTPRSTVSGPGTFDWVLCGTTGFGGAQGLARAFAAVAPGGRIAVFCQNPGGLHWLSDWRREPGDDRQRRPSVGRLDEVCDALRRLGARDVHGFALLPHHEAPRAIVPLEPPCPPAAQAAILDQVWQRGSPAAACVRALLSLVIRTGRMRRLFPHYLVAGTAPC